MLEDTVLNLYNMMAHFVATMTNAYARPAPATARPLGAQANATGPENQIPAQTAQGSQAAQQPRNSELSGSRARRESQRTHASVFDRLGVEDGDKVDSTWAPNATGGTGDLRNHLNQ